MLEIAIILGLVLVNGVFSGAEIAVISLRKTRLRELLDQGSKRAESVDQLRNAPERFFATVQIGITVVGASAAAYGGDSLREPLESWLLAAGVGKYSDSIAFGSIVALVSYLTLVLGELVPKSLALRHAEGYALLIAKPLLILSVVARPIVWFMTASSNVVLALFGDRTSFTEARHSSEELQQLVDESTKAGALDPRVGEIASRAFDLNELTAADVMVPATRIVALPRDASPEDIKRVLLEEGHSRVPIYDGTPDNIIGYVVARDLLGLVWEDRLLVLHDLIRPAYFVPETMPAPKVLRELQRRRIPMAIVVNESSHVIGLLTMEDLVEELVGEIFNENETPEELFKEEQPGVWRAQGEAAVHEINRVLGLELPESETYSTLAGLCMALAGEIPRVGKRLTTPDGTILEVLEATPRRVLTVRIRRPEPPQPVADDERGEEPTPSESAATA